MTSIQLLNGDCLEKMQELIDQNIKVDMVLTDLPYGKIKADWDNIIPFEPMWNLIHQLTSDDANVLLFGSEPFSSQLRLSNPQEYRYDWVWIKEQGTGFQTVKYRPMIKHEMISVFNRRSSKYNPLMVKLDKPRIRKRKRGELSKSESAPYERISSERTDVYHYSYPNNILYFKRDRGLHPTQKPVALLEYLIKTYTVDGDVVLDFTMGSGSTGVACVNVNRCFIGIELEEKYYDIASERINEANVQRRLI